MPGSQACVAYDMYFICIHLNVLIWSWFFKYSFYYKLFLEDNIEQLIFQKVPRLNPKPELELISPVFRVSRGRGRRRRRRRRRRRGRRRRKRRRLNFIIKYWNFGLKINVCLLLNFKSTWKQQTKVCFSLKLLISS